ncbi:potassium uptake protein KtrA [Williamsoniiplasma luminosum]|uniref:Potassium uptake protein KtrA n=1 Tax=Williamsoniiplasma luminosum TaxID=214888 RepID=A0A2K8NUB3_9MOLU|nr:TrkA family potassium uptake protein [Williamsoniiplasma luminosum]ATZ16758.1 potassium uptake protein KtrA [Williamsoniiplasma luminosum]AVP49438.1 MAG: TrkA family potassium uptake protein [Williamsoniiplasma luminosum]
MIKKKNFAIIGASNFGISVLSTLIDKKQTVTMLDSDAEKLEKAISGFDTVDTIVLDSTNKINLAKQGIAQYDGVIVAMGSNIESSLMTVLNLVDLKVKKIFVKARDDKHKRVLQALGLNENQIITPDTIAGKIVATRATFDIDADIEVQSIDDEYISTSLFVKSEDVVGKTLQEAGVSASKDFIIIQIKRKGKILIPDDYTILKFDDIVVILAKPVVINELALKIQGEMQEPTVTLKAGSILDGHPTITLEDTRKK